MTSSLAGKKAFPNSYGDSRDDLGYGRLTTKYFANRVHGDPTFPYVEPPTDTDDIDIDDEALDGVVNKMSSPRNYDPLPYSDTESQSFIGPAAKLGEATNSISPIPDLYKNRSNVAAGGTAARYPHGPTSGFTSRSRPTGDRYGYSTMYGETVDGDDPAYSLEDIAEKQIDEIRLYIRLILLENRWD